MSSFDFLVQFHEEVCLPVCLSGLGNNSLLLLLLETRIDLSVASAVVLMFTWNKVFQASHAPNQKPKVLEQHPLKVLWLWPRSAKHKGAALREILLKMDLFSGEFEMSPALQCFSFSSPPPSGFI